MRKDIQRGQSPVDFIEQSRHTINTPGGPLFEVVDKDRRPVMPDLYDLIEKWMADKESISRQSMVNEFAYMLFEEVNQMIAAGKVARTSNGDLPAWARLQKPDFIALASRLLEGTKRRHEDKEWRLKDRVPIQVFEGYEDHGTGIRGVVIDFDPSDGMITWMPDWGCGEKMFRRYVAGGVGGPKAEIWKDNLKNNYDKTKFRKGIKEFQGTGRGKTAIIVGNGASLRRNGDLLKKHPNAIVLGCNSALSLFKNPNEIFDFYCVVDHNDTEKTRGWLYDEDKPRDFQGHVLGCITAMKVLAERFGKDVHWFAGSDVIGGLSDKYPKKKWSEKRMRMKVAADGYDWEKDVVEEKEEWSVMVEGRWARKLGWVADSKSVAIYLMHFAWATLEVDSIILTGMDFAGSPDGYWTPNTANVYIPDMYTIQDMYGYACPTRPAYQTARKQADVACMFLTDAGVPVVNCSEGGTLTWGVRMKLKDAYEKIEQGDFGKEVRDAMAKTREEESKDLREVAAAGAD